MRVFFTILFCSLLLFHQSQAQQGTDPITSAHKGYVSNELLVQLTPKASLPTLLKELSRPYPDLVWEQPEQLVPNMALWRLRYQGAASVERLLELAWQSKEVAVAQFNHYVSLRSPQATTPNDLLFNNQWQYINPGGGGGTAGVDLDIDDAWDVTTGGNTANGDTIVVAVIDNGLNPNHADWGDNLWRNHAEIPSNNIDDDGNGFVDDHYGWNTNTGDDNISGGTHGTSVAGIIGAQGNNGSGVTGVNWDVKMMIIRNDFNTTEANVLIAYGYILTQRRRYNQSGGTQGAYVVVSNASWGVDQGKPNDSPLWCGFYDTLGAAGILNVAATANQEWDVETEGDLPTTCTSDYLIGVTNVNRAGRRQFNSAFGGTSIDLGAFGEGVYTTTNSGYGNFGGTSGASPHVAGAIALLHAGACSNFATYALVNPSGAALDLKRYILDGVVPINDLATTTVSGGYLNINNSLSLCLNDCPNSTCFEPYQIITNSVTDTEGFFSWQTSADVLSVQYRYRVVGGAWTPMIPLGAGVNNVQLIGLTACSDYELELVGLCANGVNSDTAQHTFRTDGCCEAPSGVLVLTNTLDSVYIQWQPVLAASQYIVEYRLQDSTNWTSVNAATTSIWLRNLLDCRNYEVRVNSRCNTGATVFGRTMLFTSRGCQDCTAVLYCGSVGGNSSSDWIKTVTVNNYTHNSGDDNGYLLIPNTSIELGRGDQHNFTIEQGNAYVQEYAVFVDLNQDGDFVDPGEEVLTGGMAINQNSDTRTFILPDTALLGVSRMRVSMRWRAAPPACDTFSFGEVQDYCIRVIRGINVDQISGVSQQLQVAPNPFQGQLTLSLDAVVTDPLTVELINTTGQVLYQQAWLPDASGTTQLPMPAALPAGMYVLRVYGATQQWVVKVVKQP